MDTLVVLNFIKHIEDSNTKRVLTDLMTYCQELEIRLSAIEPKLKPKPVPHKDEKR